MRGFCLYPSSTLNNGTTSCRSRENDAETPPYTLVVAGSTASTGVAIRVEYDTHGHVQSRTRFGRPHHQPLIVLRGCAPRRSPTSPSCHFLRPRLRAASASRKMDLPGSLGFLPPTAVPPRALRALSFCPLPSQRLQPLRRARVAVASLSPADEDERPRDGEEPEGSVDWNASWAEFRGSGMVSDAPAGREAVTKREMAARRASARVRSSVQNAAASVPSRQALFRDWRFWLGIIFALSLFSAFVNSTAVPDAPAGGVGVV